MAKRLMVACGILTLTGMSLFAQSKSSINGVWRRVEMTVTNPDATPGGFTKGTHTNLQPGLLIFTAKHYSVQVDAASKPRPPIKILAKPTPEEMQDAWAPYTANSGTYELLGSTLIMRPIVAKNPATQGKTVNRATIKLEGDTLWMTLIETGAGKVQYPTTAKYVRLE